MVIIRQVKKTDLETEQYLIWNAFIDLVAMEEYEDLNKVQRIAHLCFWYESEVSNGGHLQYFENHKAIHLEETIEALRILGAASQAKILEAAGKQYLNKKRKSIKSVFQYGFLISRNKILRSRK